MKVMIAGRPAGRPTAPLPDLMKIERSGREVHGGFPLIEVALKKTRV